MKEVVIKKVDNLEGCEYIVYPTSYINPLLKRSELNANLKKVVDAPCNVLFDLLLCNGNCFNRFCKGIFDGQQILNDSLELVDIRNEKEIEVIEKYYLDNTKVLKNGVLTPKEYMQHC
ncbi:MAG: type II toxin-antitoxin system RnlB family antitoxin [Lachnospiraceae bacterium]